MTAEVLASLYPTLPDAAVWRHQEGTVPLWHLMAMAAKARKPRQETA